LATLSSSTEVKAEVLHETAEISAYLRNRAAFGGSKKDRLKIMVLD
jgi:hypothetical protein